MPLEIADEPHRTLNGIANGLPVKVLVYPVIATERGLLRGTKYSSGTNREVFRLEDGRELIPFEDRSFKVAQTEIVVTLTD